MSNNDSLVRKFKDEAVAVYALTGDESVKGFRRYVISTRDTRDLMNHPEIINCDFTNLMQNGVTNVLKGLNMVEKISSIDSQTVNVYHILRGGLNFQIRNALAKAFGYKWHSSSYISSQRILKEGKYEISEDSYRKFRVPDNATIYTADIVASGVSLDHGIGYIARYLTSKKLSLKNFIFLCIGCEEAENVCRKWHHRFQGTFPNYEKTIVIYLEGRFSLAGHLTPLRNVLFHTDLLKNFKLGALLSPEFEHSQFERMNIALEGCAIYDGGKKSFEPVNHIRDVLDYWQKQERLAIEDGRTLWDEYNARFSLEHYVQSVDPIQTGPVEILQSKKQRCWVGLEEWEYLKLYRKFRYLWSDERILSAQRPGSLRRVCEKKIKYLKSLIGTE